MREPNSSPARKLPRQSSAELPAVAELLLCCARTRVEPLADRIRVLARGDLDWPVLVRTADLQGVTPLVYRSLNQVCPELVPAPLLAGMQSGYRVIARSNLHLTAELLRLLKRFQADGIPAIPFKGPVLAVSAYRNLALRQFGDLDILLRAADIERARALLASDGYAPGLLHPGWEYHYTKENARLTVDLHERLASRYFPSLAAFSELWARAGSVMVSGTQVPSLPVEDVLLLLSLHVAKDSREWKERLSQVCDIAELVESHPELQWDTVLARAEERGARRILFLGLHLARQLLGIQLPELVVRRMESEPRASALAARVRGRLLQQAGGALELLQFRTKVFREDSVFQLTALERGVDKIRYVGLFAREHLRLWLAPSQRDRRFVTLPAPLDFLYYVIRPLRVLGERLRRAGRNA